MKGKINKMNIEHFLLCESIQDLKQIKYIDKLILAKQFNVSVKQVTDTINKILFVYYKV